MSMNLSDSQMKELRDIFRAEAREHIRTIAKILIPLADEGIGADNAIDLLGKCYVAAHAIKGSSSTVGLPRISALAEKLEQTINSNTQGKRDLTNESLEIYLELLDAIHKAVESPSEACLDLTEAEVQICRRLDELLNAPVPTPRATAISIEPPPPPGRDSLAPDAPASELPPPSDGPPAVTESGTRDSGELPVDQIQYLMSVFQAEASEHIKSLAELLFTLEEGSGDVSQILIEAFREAHSLKGSSGTIGFERVATVTHAMEDVLGALKSAPDRISPDIIDTLLDTLDIIRRSVKEGVIGDGNLSPREANISSALREIVSTLSAGDGDAKPGAKAVPKEATKSKKPSAEPSRSSRPSSGAPTSQKRKSVVPERPSKIKTAGQSKDAFIRVSEEAINNLVAQVGELFEAHLYLSSATAAFGRLESTVDELTALASALNVENEESENGQGSQFVDLITKLKALKTQTSTLNTRINRDEKQFSKLIQNSQDGLRKIRLAPISTIFVMIRRQVREICRLTGKRVELFLDGGEYAVDRKVLEAIEDPLIHILRNAVDHGIEDPATRRKVGKNEKGRINVVARHVGDAVELSIVDDGRGINPENIRKSLKEKGLMDTREIDKLSSDQLFDCLFESGFSTQRDVSKISGRGVGLDVVKFTMERLGGEVRLDSYPGTGSEFCLRLPLSMSTMRCLLVRVANRAMAIPASNVDKVLLMQYDETKVVGGGEVITYQEQNIPLGTLSGLLNLTSQTSRATSSSGIVVIISFGERRFALFVDDIIEYAQLILRPLGDLLERVSYISGISLLGTGEIALVLNPSDLVRASGSSYVKRAREQARGHSEIKYTARVLVVDDSLATRSLEKALLESAGYTVVTASDGYKALEVINTQKCDIVISDIQMPNMDGLTLTQTIKTQYRFLQLPVVLVSSLGSDEDKERGMASGADAYIVKKDLSQSELVETIEQLL